MNNFNFNKIICFGIFGEKKLKHYLVSFNIGCNKYLYMLKMLNGISLKIIPIRVHTKKNPIKYKQL